MTDPIFVVIASVRPEQLAFVIFTLAMTNNFSSDAAVEARY